MNKQVILCRTVAAGNRRSQHELARELNLPLETAERSIRAAVEDGLVHSEGNNHSITDKGLAWLEPYRVDNAIIMAAGLGQRFAPLTHTTPKGLLEVKGTPMINRQIEQLIEAGVTEIIVVVGYLAEMFEHLPNTYGVTLIHNPEYAVKNNYASLYQARHFLGSSYVLAADNWIEENMFHAYEPDSWISCVYQEGESAEWGVTLGAQDRITRIDYSAKDNWGLVGPAYFSREFSQKYVPLLEDCYARPDTVDYYWEHVIAENINELPLYINKQSGANVYEFECIDELRRYDSTAYISEPKP